MPVKKYKADDQILYFSKSVENGRAIAMIKKVGKWDAERLNAGTIQEVNGPFSRYFDNTQDTLVITVEKLMDLLKDVPC